MTPATQTPDVAEARPGVSRNALILLAAWIAAGAALAAAPAELAGRLLTFVFVILG